jgi:hypothetical protein
VNSLEGRKKEDLQHLPFLASWRLGGSNKGAGSKKKPEEKE